MPEAEVIAAPAPERLALEAPQETELPRVEGLAVESVDESESFVETAKETPPLAEMAAYADEILAAEPARLLEAHSPTGEEVAVEAAPTQAVPVVEASAVPEETAVEVALETQAPAEEITAAVEEVPVVEAAEEEVPAAPSLRDSAGLEAISFSEPPPTEEALPEVEASAVPEETTVEVALETQAPAEEITAAVEEVPPVEASPAIEAVEEIPVVEAAAEEVPPAPSLRDSAGLEAISLLEPPPTEEALPIVEASAVPEETAVEVALETQAPAEEMTAAVEEVPPVDAMPAIEAAPEELAASVEETTFLEQTPAEDTAVVETSSGYEPGRLSAQWALEQEAAARQVAVIDDTGPEFEKDLQFHVPPPSDSETFVVADPQLESEAEANAALEGEPELALSPEEILPPPFEPAGLAANASSDQEQTPMQEEQKEEQLENTQAETQQATPVEAAAEQAPSESSAEEVTSIEAAAEEIPVEEAIAMEAVEQTPAEPTEAASEATASEPLVEEPAAIEAAPEEAPAEQPVAEAAASEAPKKPKRRKNKKAAEEEAAAAQLPVIEGMTAETAPTEEETYVVVGAPPEEVLETSSQEVSAAEETPAEERLETAGFDEAVTEEAPTELEAAEAQAEAPVEKPAPQAARPVEPPAPMPVYPEEPAICEWDIDILSSTIESILFVTEKPISFARIKEAFLDAEKPTDYQLSLVMQSIASRYEHPGAGFQLRHAQGGYHFVTKVENAEYIRRFQASKPFRLGRSALEVLAIVAYRQPITRAEIDQVRGIDSSHLMRTLMERGLVKMGGKADIPGRPVTYMTTDRFLEIVGLKSVQELPPLSELDQLQGHAEDPIKKLEQNLDKVMAESTREAEEIAGQAEQELGQIDTLIQSAHEIKEVYASSDAQEVSKENQLALECFQAETRTVRRQQRKNTVRFEDLQAAPIIDITPPEDTPVN